jgi:hypothetical protein
MIIYFLQTACNTDIHMSSVNGAQNTRTVTMEHAATRVHKQLSSSWVLKFVVCILLRVLGQVQGFRLTQHWFEYFI